MDISDPLARLNFQRYADWSRTFTPANAKQAVLAFNGDVYEGFDAKSLSSADLDYAQQHVRVLSGLYGLLRPLDLLQPYRLEMGTRFANARGKDLYAFWGDRITRALNDRSRAVRGSRVLLLGVTYKADVADARETPAVPVARRLLEMGADVRWHDPFVDDFTPAGDRLAPANLGAVGRSRPHPRTPGRTTHVGRSARRRR